MKDLRLFDKRILDRIYAENEYQLAVHGEQDRTAWEWLAYLTEEVGELSAAIQEHEYGDAGTEPCVREAIQAAALAAKIAEMYLNLDASLEE